MPIYVYLNLRGLASPTTLNFKMLQAGADMKYLRNPVFAHESKEAVLHTEKSYPDP